MNDLDLLRRGLLSFVWYEIMRFRKSGIRCEKDS